MRQIVASIMIIAFAFFDIHALAGESFIINDQLDMEINTVSENHNTDIEVDDTDEYGFYKYDLYEEQVSPYGYIPFKWLNKNGEQVLNEYSETDSKIHLFNASALPSKYDLREEGLIKAEIENQAMTGTCWAHGAVAAAESNMIKNGYAKDDVNLSEAHLVWFGLASGPFDEADPLYCDSKELGQRAFNTGGNIITSTTTLASGRGLVNESVMPDISEITYIDKDDKDPEDQTQYNPEQYPDWSDEYEDIRYDSEALLVNSNFYNVRVYDDHDVREVVKNQILETGAMTFGYGAYDSFQIKKDDMEGYYYYCPLSEYAPNHEIAVIGWNDDISRSEFEVTVNGKSYIPEGDGAWLCRNSWGTDYGDDGYFYISYYDQTFDEVGSMEMVPRDAYGKNIYQYAGMIVNSIGYEEAGVAFANIYESKDNDYISAIGLEVLNESVPYNVQVYIGGNKYDPTSGVKIYETCGTFDTMGYHTIDFNENINVGSSEYFSVVVRYNANAMVVPVDDYNNNGLSFVRPCNASSGKLLADEWKNTENEDYEVYMNVLTANSSKKDSDITIEPLFQSGSYNEGLSLELFANDEDTDIYYTLDGSDPSVYGHKYEAPISLEQKSVGKVMNYIVKAVAKKGNDSIGKVETFFYNVYKETKFKAVCEVEQIKDIPNGTDLWDIELPKTVQIETEDIGVIDAYVKWDLDEFEEGTYSDEIEQAQTFVLKGMAELPVYVSNKERSVKVTVKVTVDEKGKIINFFTLGGTINGSDQVIVKKGQPIPKLPRVEMKGQEFVGWEYNGIPIKEGDIYSFEGDIQVEAVYRPITLAVGQKYIVLDYFREYMDTVGGSGDYGIKLQNPSKGKLKAVDNELVFTASKVGKTEIYLTKLVGKKWEVQSAGSFTIEIVKPKVKNIKTKLDNSITINANDYFKNLPSADYNNIVWSVKNPKKKRVAEIDSDTGIIKLVNKGTATIMATVERDGYRKIYKLKIRVSK